MEPDERFTVAIEAETQGFERTMADLAQKADRFAGAMTSAFRGAAIGGRSLDGVMRQLALRISSIALDAALKPLSNLAGQALGGVLGAVSGAVGGAGASPIVTPFAKGGVVRAPTFFPNGGQIGLMGEAGAEAILPLRRGSDGRLGVAAPGASGGATSIVFNVTTPDAGSFRRSEAQIQAMLARAAQRGQRSL